MSAGVALDALRAATACTCACHGKKAAAAPEATTAVRPVLGRKDT
jgi:hypothetical protein